MQTIEKLIEENAKVFLLHRECDKRTDLTEVKDIILKDKVIKVDRDELSLLKKGDAYLVINRNNVLITVEANNFERILLNEDDFSYR